MLFYSMFKTLVGKEIAVELKNDVALTGTLHSIDQYLNIKLLDARVVDAARHPQLVAVSSVFVRGSVVRYVQLPAADVDADPRAPDASPQGERGGISGTRVAFSDGRRPARGGGGRPGRRVVGCRGSARIRDIFMCRRSIRGGRRPGRPAPRRELGDPETEVSSPGQGVAIDAAGERAERRPGRPPPRKRSIRVDRRWARGAAQF